MIFSSQLFTDEKANKKEMVSSNGLFSHKNKVMGISDLLFKKKQEKATANLKAGEDFLAENKTKENVVVLESGLQYIVLNEGSGAKPTATDQVTCHYHGTLIDGTIFDSSIQRGQPATFPLSGVIKGWTEGVQLMNVGSKYRFFIPSDLAYGERTVSSEIGSNATLIFDVELLEIS